ncbi:phosphomannomutase/phosphoglucomutase [Hahella ganghwensis]|uniref:phosphomannomutase/phosphoglucomutase n=1 Tax=Hahella ganghwensis TaxID=286420 RepID=UPI00037EED2B|nr:phosphomannomutase/phosphoglucomutase [Hahella ganghwensis]
MKLEKKKKAKPDDQGPDKTAVKNKTKTGLKSPAFYTQIAAVFGAIAVLVAAAVLYATTIVPAQISLERERNSASLQALAAVFSQKLQQVQTMVSHYAENIPTETLLSSENLGSNEYRAMKAMPGAMRVVISATGRASRDDRKPLPVSFASLDLVRSVEQSGKGRLEAFVLDNRWYIQVVMPVLAKDKTVAGTILVMLDANTLAPDWKTLPEGGVQLMQTVSGKPQVVISRGEQGKDALNQDTALGNWEVSYSPSSSQEPLVDLMMFWIIAGVGAVLGAILSALAMTLFIKPLRKDVGQVSGFVVASFQGEKPTVPRIKLDVLHSMVVLVEQARKKQKPVAAPASKPAVGSKPPTKPAKTESAKPAPAKESEELGDAEPLFQGDSLDIDMLGDDEDLLGLNDDDLNVNEEGVGVSETAMVDVDAEIFRAYDIRGIVDQNLTPQVMMEIGRAYGSEAVQKGVDRVCVGYDGRESSPVLAKALIKGITSTGVEVINVGMVPTPVLYFATHHFKTGSGAMVTGSHNPANYNGIKLMLAGDTLAQEDIQALLRRIRTQNYVRSQAGVSETDIKSEYINAVVGDIAVAAPLKVVIDAGNGVAGDIAPKLVEELGCDVVPLYCDVDSQFPNHHPDPGKPANLQDLIAKVKEVGADIGIAFDGDGDRIGVVTGQGKIIWPDRLLMLFAKDVVSRNPGADVIFDVKCSRRLNGLISSVGGRPVMWKTGHSLIKAKMKETGALLAGEMSGHIFFKERWLGFDDGLYSMARLLEILGIDDRNADEMFEEFPEDVSTPELNVEVGEAAKFRIMEMLSQRANWGDANVSGIDGIRVEYSDGWGLCRASNTTPVLVLRFEAETEDALARIQRTFKTQLQAIDSSLKLPF